MNILSLIFLMNVKKLTILLIYSIIEITDHVPFVRQSKITYSKLMTQKCSNEYFGVFHQIDSFNVDTLKSQPSVYYLVTHDNTINLVRDPSGLNLTTSLRT